MLDLDKISEELFNKIRGRFSEVTIGDQEGTVTNVPKDARYFDFKYDEDSNVSVSISEKDGVVIMYNNELFTKEQSIQKSNWYSFLKELRSFARKRLLNFDVRDITKSNLNKRDYKYLATNSGDDNMTESKLYGTGKVSYQNVDSARIVIKHTESVNQERAGGRTQKIGTIHIESVEGERFKYPFKHLNGARAMARHVAEGGNAYDDFGKHIVGMSEELSKLKKFKNHMSRNGVMAEGLAEYSDVVNDRIDAVKRTVETLQRKNVYAEAVANFESTILEDVPDDVSSNWIDQLTIRQFNEELSDVFPYIYKLVSEHTKALSLGPQELLGEAVGQQIFLDFQKHLTDIERTTDTEEFTAKLEGLGYRSADSEDYEIDLDDVPVKITIDAFGSVQEGEFKIVSVVGDDGTQYVLDQTDTWDIGMYTDAFSDALATESAEEIGIDAHFDGMMGQFGEETAEETMVCKDCGDEMHKPTSDCKHDCDDESGSWWMPKSESSYNEEEVSEAYINTSKDAIDVLGALRGKGKKIERGQDDDQGNLANAYANDVWDVYSFIEARTKGFKGLDKSAMASIEAMMKLRGEAKKLERDADSGKNGKFGNQIVNTLYPVIEYLYTTDFDRNAKEDEAECDDDPAMGKEGAPAPKEQKTPLGEFIVSYYDREAGEFPKGETAILTMIEKDYGEQYITPAKQFIGRLQATVEQHQMQTQPQQMETEGSGMEADEVQAILAKHPKAAAALKQGADIMDHDDLYDDLYAYFADSGDMPYGIQKARDGDPYDWVHDKLDSLGLLGEESQNMDRIRELAGLR